MYQGRPYVSKNAASPCEPTFQDSGAQNPEKGKENVQNFEVCLCPGNGMSLNHYCSITIEIELE